MDAVTSDLRHYEAQADAEQRRADWEEAECARRLAICWAEYTETGRIDDYDLDAEEFEAIGGDPRDILAKLIFRDLGDLSWS